MSGELWVCVAVLMEPGVQTWELVGREVVCARVWQHHKQPCRSPASSLFLTGSHLILQPKSVSREVWAWGSCWWLSPEILVISMWLFVPFPWGGSKWTHRTAFPNLSVEIHPQRSPRWLWCPHCNRNYLFPLALDPLKPYLLLLKQQCMYQAKLWLSESLHL